MRFLLIKSFQMAGYLSYVPDKAIAAGGGWQERSKQCFLSMKAFYPAAILTQFSIIPEAYFGTGAFTP